MKKLIAFVLATLLTVSMAACSVSTESKDKKALDTSTISAAESEAKAESQAESEAKAESQAEAEAEKPEIAASGTLGDYEVEIKSAYLTEDYDGKPAIVVTYKLTNNSSETSSFFMALNRTAFQNGVELDLATVPDEDFKSNMLKDIKPGASIESDEAYLLNDEKSPVDIEITEFLSTSDEKLTASFDLTSAK